MPKASFGLTRDTYTLTDGAKMATSTGSLGPAIVLTQGEPVAIAVTNHMNEPTSVHWHGIGLENSYYDGGAGMRRMAGMGRIARISHAIEPGRTFVARFAPPDAGTFMYHSHLNDGWQLAGGLIGPLIVLPRDTRLDPQSDHIVMISEAFETAGAGPIAIDGFRAPQPMAVAAGVSQRLRFANLTLGGENLVVSLYDGTQAMTWTPIAKDGRDLPTALQQPGIAIHALTIGETRDFRFTPHALALGTSPRSRREPLETEKAETQSDRSPVNYWHSIYHEECIGAKRVGLCSVSSTNRQPGAAKIAFRKPVHVPQRSAGATLVCEFA